MSSENRQTRGRQPRKRGCGNAVLCYNPPAISALPALAGPLSPVRHNGPMRSTLCLFACALVAAQQPAGSGDWQIVPRLNRGEELVYRGTYTEEATGRGVQFKRGQRLEHRVFILDATPKGLDAALFTIIKEQLARTVSEAKSSQPVSVRLEVARVSPRGRVTDAGQDVSFPMPLESAASIETGSFVELKHVGLRVGEGWEIVEPGRPPQAWKVVGTEAVNGTTCIKLIGIQQADEWDAPRGDRPAWRRMDTVWLAPNLGVALRFERAIEHREPGRREASQRMVTEYTLENRMSYGQLAEDRRREIMLVYQLGERIKPHLKEPQKSNPQMFDEVLSRIAQHMEKQPATPYRQAMVHFQRRVEAARRGEAVPVGYHEEAASPPTTIALGQPAPDFVTTDLSKREGTRLRKLLGKPILMVFYNPVSRNAQDVLKFAQQIGDMHRPDVIVIGMAVSDDADLVLKQGDDLKLTFPLLSGQGLRLTYAVDATPKLVVLDAHGIVRGAYVGWGREVPDLVREELARWKGK